MAILRSAIFPIFIMLIAIIVDEVWIGTKFNLSRLLASLPIAFLLGPNIAVLLTLLLFIFGLRFKTYDCFDLGNGKVQIGTRAFDKSDILGVSSVSNAVSVKLWNYLYRIETIDGHVFFTFGKITICSILLFDTDSDKQILKLNQW